MSKQAMIFENSLTLTPVKIAKTAFWLALSSLAAQSALAQGVIGSSEASNTLVQEYCVECHNLEDYSGGVAFDLMDLGHVDQEPEVWEEAINKLRGRLMPPAGQPQPAQSEVDALVGYLETSIDTSAQTQHIGHVPIQRLNRTEFATTVKGLIGVDIDAEQILPSEIEVEGFDNIANALGSSPSFLEQYIAATRLVATQAVGTPLPKYANVFHELPDRNIGFAGGSSAARNHVDGFPLGTRGGMSFTHFFPADGEYRFNILDIDAGLYPRGMETAATMVILVDGVEVNRVEIGGPEDLAIATRDGVVGGDVILAKLAGLSANVEVGTHEVIVTFIERSWGASNNATGNGRVTGMPRIGLGVEVEGPYEPRGLSLSESRERIFICQPSELAEERSCAEDIAQNLATKAFRRPVGAEDLEWLMPFYETGRAEEGGFDSGVIELVTAILSSPDFLYRSLKIVTEEPRDLNDLELASRLSFFLWSQGPDEELIALAADGQLSNPATMEAQVSRMLTDPRARALVENFALAWLNLDELGAVEPSDRGFNNGMRTNYETEIRLFLASVLLEERSVHELLTADWTFLNDSLANQYGISGVLGSQFRRVTLEDENRWGLLGKGATLLRTSYGDRTSPVLRGAWVLDRIMGTPPAPPPPNVEVDLSIREGDIPTTVRARLEEHRGNPTCMACHGLIDPPGLALENFDVTGRWRDIDPLANATIDASTVLTSGKKLNGPVELRNHLLSREDQLPTTITKRLMMYALNREIEYFDMPQVRKIVRAAAENNYTFASIITQIVNNEVFRQQGPEEHENAIASTEIGVRSQFP
ncbi:MAG: mono/diheme cytochrome c family protein [Pseudohongiellaceae bacterium]|jgi:mono/diheme cytochrome c family protein